MLLRGNKFEAFYYRNWWSTYVLTNYLVFYRYFEDLQRTKMEKILQYVCLLEKHMCVNKLETDMWLVQLSQSLDLLFAGLEGKCNQLVETTMIQQITNGNKEKMLICLLQMSIHAAQILIKKLTIIAHKRS